MRAGHEAEASECGEKVILSRFRNSRLRVRMKVAHRERVDQDAIEKRIRKSGFRGHAVMSFITWRGDKCQCLSVRAQAVMNRELQITLRVHGSAQVIVQVTTFRHFTEKSLQQWRTVADRVEIARSALLCSLSQSKNAELEEEDDETCGAEFSLRHGAQRITLRNGGQQNAASKSKASQSGRLLGFKMELAISVGWLSRWSRWDCSCRSRSLWLSCASCDASWLLLWSWCCSDRPTCSVLRSRFVRCCWTDHRSTAQSSSNPSTRVQIPSLVASSLCFFSSGGL